MDIQFRLWLKIFVCGSSTVVSSRAHVVVASNEPPFSVVTSFVSTTRSTNSMPGHPTRFSRRAVSPRNSTVMPSNTTT
jgi:hypothetical protein